MSDILDKMRDAAFSTDDTDEVRYTMLGTSIGPVVFGSDGSMKYGDNLEEDVPQGLRETARSSAIEQFRKPQP